MQNTGFLTLMNKGLRPTNISYETNPWEKGGPLINERRHIISGD